MIAKSRFASALCVLATPARKSIPISRGPCGLPGARYFDGFFLQIVRQTDPAESTTAPLSAQRKSGPTFLNFPLASNYFLRDTVRRKEELLYVKKPCGYAS